MRGWRCGFCFDGSGWGLSWDIDAIAAVMVDAISVGILLREFIRVVPALCVIIIIIIIS